jgi:hypothetical protein
MSNNRHFALRPTCVSEHESGLQTALGNPSVIPSKRDATQPTHTIKGNPHDTIQTTSPHKGHCPQNTPSSVAPFAKVKDNILVKSPTQTVYVRPKRQK